MAGYIVDIFLPQLLVAIEADGKNHEETKDKKREQRIITTNIGLRFLRYKNGEITAPNFKQRLKTDLLTISGCQIWAFPSRDLTSQIKNRNIAGVTTNLTRRAGDVAPSEPIASTCDRALRASPEQPTEMPALSRVDIRRLGRGENAPPKKSADNGRVTSTSTRATDHAAGRGLPRLLEFSGRQGSQS